MEPKYGYSQRLLFSGLVCHVLNISLEQDESIWYHVACDIDPNVDALVEEKNISLATAPVPTIKAQQKKLLDMYRENLELHIQTCKLSEWQENELVKLLAKKTLTNREFERARNIIGVTI